MRKYVLLIFTLLIVGLNCMAQKEIAVHPNVNIIKDQEYFHQGTREAIAPGDILVLEGDADGSRSHVQLNNVHGTADNPIVITHPVGTSININTANTYGIYLNNCTHVIIDGGRNAVELWPSTRQQYYGIQIRIQEAGQSIKAENGSSDLTIRRVWIEGQVPQSDSPAILVKSNAQCHPETKKVQYSERTFLLRNLTIADNRIENAGSEAIYIGETGMGKAVEPGCYIEHDLGLDFDIQTGRLINLQLFPITEQVDSVKPHYLDNVVVADNTIINPGWDGIQLSWCHNFSVSGNAVYNYGVKQQGSQNSGIIIGAGCSGVVHNNYIGRGSGSGIEARPSGNTWIFNNVLAYNGTTAENELVLAAINTYAIFIKRSFTRGRNVVGEKRIHVSHNLIYRGAGCGIRMNNQIRNTQTQQNEANAAYQSVIMGNALAEIQHQNIPDGVQHKDIQIQGANHPVNRAYPNYNNPQSSEVNYVTDALSQLALSNAHEGLDPAMWDVRPTAYSPLVDKMPLMYENVEFKDYHQQDRGPYTGLLGPWLSRFQGAGSGPDMGPAERIMPFVRLPFIPNPLH